MNTIEMEDTIIQKANVQTGKIENKKFCFMTDLLCDFLFKS